MERAGDVDHDLVVVDEFDALSIELNVPRPNPSKVKVKVSDPPSLGHLGKYPAKTHARKVVKELGVQDGLIYLPGLASQLFEDSDMAPEFRQRRYFYYMSGLDFADCAVTYDITKDSLTLWIPYTDPQQKLWFGSTPSPEECMAKTEVDNVRYTNTLERALYVYLKLNPTVPIYILHADQAPKLDRFSGQVHLNTAKLRPAIDEARVIKTDYEVAMIRQATKISSEAHRAVLEELLNLTNEREIEAIFRAYGTANGAKHQAYPIIAGSGPNAATLHYGANNEPLEGRQLVVLDAAAEWDVYASDVTRTFPISGKFTPEAEAVYAAVYRMQTEVIDRIGPGVVYATLQVLATKIATEELLKLGILHNGSVKDILSQGTTGAFFPHGLGHHVGLEVHDVQGGEKLMTLYEPTSPAERMALKFGIGQRQRKSKREWMTAQMHAHLYQEVVSGAATASEKRKAVEPNMIFTVEPGIYFCREYIEAFFLSNPDHARYINKTVLERFYPVGGVRIEDCVLVTPDGHENLTTAPKGKEMLKIINGEA